MTTDQRRSSSSVKARSRVASVRDCVAFPFRAIFLHHDDRFGMSSLRSERFYYVAQEVQGRTLDIGCGRGNTFVTEYLDGNGVGIDVFRYDGLAEDQVFDDLTRLPYPDASFDSVTFIANLNHVPKDVRDAELAEAYRCLRPEGNIIVTMGNPVAEVLVHKLVHFSDHRLGTHIDVDTERGMHEDEDYYLTDSEIVERLARAGFRDIRRKRFGTQWGLNHMFVGWR